MKHAESQDGMSGSPECGQVSVAVRRLGSSDDALVRSAVNRFDGNQTADPTEFLSDPRTMAFVAEEGGEVVGWLYSYELPRPDGRREVFLYSIDVAEQFQGQGHGRALVNALLCEARRKGYKEVWTLTDSDNLAAQGLYGNTGGATGHQQVMYQWDIS